MFVDPKLVFSLALVAGLCGCVAPEEPVAKSRPAAAARPAAADQSNYEAAPIPNRQVRGTTTSVITTDINKPRTQ